MTPCIAYGNVMVCTSSTHVTRKIMHCPTCERRRRFVVIGELYSYYAPTLTCCACGDSWGEDGRMARPFRRGWRDRAIATARQQWKDATR